MNDLARPGFDAERFSGALRGNQHNKDFMELNPFPAVYGLPLTFVVAAVVPPVLAVAALLAWRLPHDEIAHPLDRAHAR